MRLQALQNGNAAATVYVRGDRALAYGRMEVIGLVNQPGFMSVSLIAEAGAAPTAIEAQ